MMPFSIWCRLNFICEIDYKDKANWKSYDNIVCFFCTRIFVYIIKLFIETIIRITISKITLKQKHSHKSLLFAPSTKKHMCTPSLCLVSIWHSTTIAQLPLNSNVIVLEWQSIVVLLLKKRIYFEKIHQDYHLFDYDIYL